jgi:hypothetical protein
MRPRRGTIPPISCATGSPEAVQKLVELFILRFAGSAGVLPNAAYLLQPEHVKGNFESPMCLAFAGTAGVLAGSSKTNQGEQKPIKAS